MITREQRIKARWAILIDHFYLLPSDIGNLTERQIDDLYFHARTKEGEIKPVPDTSNREPTTYEQAQLRLDVMCTTFGIKPDKREELHKQLKAKWEREHASK